MARTGRLSFRKRLIFLGAICLVLLAVGETAARVYEAMRTGKTSRTYGVVDYFLPHPFINYVLNPSHPNHNSLGFRGPEVSRKKPAGMVRVFCVGGSSTYDTCVPEEHSYPYLLGASLAGRGDRRFEVVNAGAPGYTSAHVLALVAFRILSMEPDILVTYMGWNDVGPRAVGIDTSDYAGFVKAWEDVGAVRRLVFHSALLRLTVGKAAWRFGVPALQWPPHINHTVFVDPEETSHYVMRNLDCIPPTVFERNLTSIVNLCEANKVRVLLVTQSIWATPDPTPEETVLFRGVHEHAEVVRRVGLAHGMPVLDLEKIFPKERDYYADSIHMNARGNEARGRLIADAILAMMGDGR